MFAADVQQSSNHLRVNRGLDALLANDLTKGRAPNALTSSFFLTPQVCLATALNMFVAFSQYRLVGVFPIIQVLSIPHVRTQLARKSGSCMYPLMPTPKTGLTQSHMHRANTPVCIDLPSLSQTSSLRRFRLCKVGTFIYHMWQ